MQFNSKGRAHFPCGRRRLCPAECLQAPATEQLQSGKMQRVADHLDLSVKFQFLNSLLDRFWERNGEQSPEASETARIHHDFAREANNEMLQSHAKKRLRGASFLLPADF